MSFSQFYQERTPATETSKFKIYANFVLDRQCMIGQFVHSWRLKSSHWTPWKWKKISKLNAQTFTYFKNWFQSTGFRTNHHSHLEFGDILNLTDNRNLYDPEGLKIFVFLWFNRYRRKHPKVDTLFPSLFFRRVRATSMTQRPVENTRVHFLDVFACIGKK